MNNSTEEQQALDTGMLSNIHEWTDADGISRRCWDRVYHKSLAKVREYHRDAADDGTTDEEMDEAFAEMLALGIAEQLGPEEILVHYGKTIRDGKVEFFDFTADDDDGPPLPALGRDELEKAAALEN
jgi:hypothetical protein